MRSKVISHKTSQETTNTDVAHCLDPSSTTKFWDVRILAFVQTTDDGESRELQEALGIGIETRIAC
jgi:hypothetical protein